jgi:serine protease Do
MVYHIVNFKRAVRRRATQNQEVTTMSPKIRFVRYFMAVLMAALMLGAGLPFATASKNAPAVRMVPENFSVLAEAAGPAVVNIRVEKTVSSSAEVPQSGSNPFGNDERSKEFFDHFFGGRQVPEQFKQSGLGTGFIIDKSGYIVTNNHVVADADKITVVLEDEREFDAKVIGRDPQTDLAVIKIDAKKDLPTLPLGRSTDLKVGEWVVAIGNPFGLDHTVTAGIVSAKGRVIGAGPYDDFIQTDASINPGNSGGPLLNMNGEVVGVNSAIIASGQGIGFAIPIDMAKTVIAQLKENGQVTRGWLGVTIQDVKGDLAQYYGIENGNGALVTDVVPGNPADKAGIQPKDIIVKVNNDKIAGSHDLTAKVAKLGVGDTARLTVLRNGQEKVLDVTVGKRPLTLAQADTPQPEKDSEYGFQVTDLTPQISQRLDLKEDRGVVVVGVKPGSKAEKAGVQQGDLIVEVNHQGVQSVAAFKELLTKHPSSQGVDLLVKRMNAGMMVIHLA